jgi:hypothetical protein
MNRRFSTVSFETLLADSKLAPPASDRALLNDAEVIYAVQPGVSREVLVYGREKLQRIAASEIPEGARVLRVGLSDGGRQLESLLALVHETKGSHDYVPPLSTN